MAIRFPPEPSPANVETGLRYVSVIDLRNILDAQIRIGNAHGTVAVMHNGEAFDIVNIKYNTDAEALVLVAVDDKKP